MGVSVGRYKWPQLPLGWALHGSMRATTDPGNPGVPGQPVPSMKESVQRWDVVSSAPSSWICTPYDVASDSAAH